MFILEKGGRPHVVARLAVAAGLAAAVATAAHAQSQRTADLDLGWRTIPAGTFEMGCVPGDDDCHEEELPRHLVTISRAFDLMAKEATVRQYHGFVEAVGIQTAPPPRFSQTDDDPIVNVSWEEAAAFCQWAGGRLPTEAEWEYAARGGDNRRIYPWGNQPSHDAANYGEDECCAGLASGADRWVNTAPAGSFPPNGFGLYDMGGNVWEWVADWFGEYDPGRDTDPKGPRDGDVHLARGGSWLNVPTALRASLRLPFSGSTSNTGFRCARVPVGLRAAVNR